MSRRILFLLCPLLFILTLSAAAQATYPSLLFPQPEPAPPSTKPWVADTIARPRFPITVKLKMDEVRLIGTNFIGGGTAHVYNPHGEDLSFKYRCDIVFPSFQPADFYARWITPGRKLEIVLRKPGTDHTRTCRINTSPV